MLGQQPEQFDDGLPAELFDAVQEDDGESDGSDILPDIFLSEGDDDASSFSSEQPVVLAAGEEATPAYQRIRFA